MNKSEQNKKSELLRFGVVKKGMFLFFILFIANIRNASLKIYFSYTIEM